MKIEQQVCSLEQAKKLTQLGIFDFGSFYYVDNTINGLEGIKQRKDLESVKRLGVVKDGGAIRYYPAYTISELGAMLSEYFDKEGDGRNDNHKVPYEVIEKYGEKLSLLFNPLFLADILLHCLVNGKITADDCNNALKS